MSLRKLKGIRSVGAYTAQRSVLEHLLLFEEIILSESLHQFNIPNERKFIAQQLKEYKTQHRINSPFDIEDIQNYFLAATIRVTTEESQIRGIYTSTLIEQTEGDEPIIIDMKKREINHLLLAINTPRHITINNTKGDWTGTYAGNNGGQANLTINNTEGNYTGMLAGSNHGTAHLTINNTEGDHTGRNVGSYRGNAHLNINNTKGDNTGRDAGSYRGNAHLNINNTKGDNTGRDAGFNGNAIIVACNNKGANPFLMHQGILVFKNSDIPPRIEGVDHRQRKQILNLIAQNAPSEEIMDYLRGNT